MNEPYVDAHAIATHLGGMSHLTVLQWAKASKIPGTKPGKKWLFKVSEVEAALNPPSADPFAQSSRARTRNRA